MLNPKQYLGYASQFGLGKKKIFWLIFFGLSALVFEAVGISIFLPILEFARLKADPSLTAAQGVFWSKAVDVLSNFGITPSLELLIAIALIAFMVRQGFVFISSIFRVKVSSAFTRSIRNQLFSAYLSSKTEYQEQMSPGDLTNSITTEVNRGASVILLPIDIFINFLVATLYVGILLMVSVPMTLAAITILSIASFLPRRWIQQSKKVGRSQTSVNAALSQHLLQRLHQPRLIRLQSADQKEINDFSEFTNRQMGLAIKNFVLKTKTQLSIEPFVIATSLAFVYAAIKIYSLPIEVIGVYLVIILRLVPVAKGTIGLWQTVTGNFGAFENINNRLWALKRHEESWAGTETFIALATSLDTKDLCYQYPGETRDALRLATVSIPAKKVTALVGSSGSGKSTFVDLITGIRKSRAGEVLFDGVSIEKFDIKSIRRGIRYIPQSPSIYSGTIREHITYGSDTTDVDGVVHALDLVGLREFVSSLPEGIETQLGEHGSRLSGGQKQRMELARGLYAKAGCIILDEPTSSLDAISAHEVHQVLMKLSTNDEVTVIFIAHSLKFAHDADNIIVFRRGVVDAQGTHDQLLKNSAWYARAYRINDRSERELEPPLNP